jgi:hypothetical protein
MESPLTPPPSPPRIQGGEKESPFLEALRVASEREASHYQRQEEDTRRWFEKHPENRHELFEIDWRDTQLRFENCVDIELRFGRGWWERVTDDAWIGLPQQRFERRDYLWDLPPEESVSEMEYVSRKTEPAKFGERAWQPRPHPKFDAPSKMKQKARLDGVK